jgi:hypothetical protein
MNEKVIEFLAHEDYFNLKEDYPTPIKFNLPEWYKKLEHKVESKTIKGCMPVLDTLTTGYLLKVPQDYSFRHTFRNENGKQVPFFEFDPLNTDDGFNQAKSINLAPSQPNYHPTDQAKGSPLVDKNNKQPFLKIFNPWIIKTPPGYSCLFLPPMNNTDDRFSIIPGMVDTDSFPNEINFPIIVNGDKYPNISTIIKKGTPYVQIIPFKRESWKMKIKSATTQFIRKSKLSYFLQNVNIYKNKFWFKKKWN